MRQNFKPNISANNLSTNQWPINGRQIAEKQRPKISRDCSFNPLGLLKQFFSYFAYFLMAGVTILKKSNKRFEVNVRETQRYINFFYIFAKCQIFAFLQAIFAKNVNSFRLYFHENLFLSQPKVQVGSGSTMEFLNHNPLKRYGSATLLITLNFNKQEGARK